MIPGTFCSVQSKESIGFDVHQEFSRFHFTTFFLPNFPIRIRLARGSVVVIRRLFPLLNLRTFSPISSRLQLAFKLFLPT